MLLAIYKHCGLHCFVAQEEDRQQEDRSGAIGREEGRTQEGGQPSVREAFQDLRHR